MGNVIVLFEVTVENGKMEDYFNMAASLKESPEAAKGFIRSERFSSVTTENKLLSLSVWEDEESVTRWRNQEAHRVCQRQGRAGTFLDYKITVATPVRTYSMSDRREVPADSNEFWEG